MASLKWCEMGPEQPFFAPGDELPLKPLKDPPSDWQAVALCDRGNMCNMSGPDYGYFPHHIATTKATITDLMENFRLRSDDIMIATYPKCGTTWVQQIVLLLLADGDIAKVPHPMVLSPWLEQSAGRRAHGGVSGEAAVIPEQFRVPLMNAAEFNEWDPPEASRVPGSKPRRVFKTHSPPHLAPWKGGVPDGVPPTGRVIVVSRGPRDAAISYLHHYTSALKHMKYDTSDPDHFYKDQWGRGRVVCGDFYTWYKTWWDAPLGKDQKLWLRYEDLQVDPEGAVRKIAAFLDITVSDQLVAKVVQASSFSSMKQQFTGLEKKADEVGVWAKKEHIRKGETGGWREALTQEQQEWFNQHDKRRREESGVTEEAVAHS
eukprot:Hpha_TRINITY_DN15172_c0_g1::TRINITY_DN15172_c0_g1_i1::g.127948::m.127948/K01025/SULT1; sulfotransferase